MIPLSEYPHLHQNQTLKEAIIKIEGFQIKRSGMVSMPRVLLVLDESHKLVGLARRRDIMRGLEPEFLVTKPLRIRKALFDIEVDPNLSEMQFDKLIHGLVERSKRPVRDIMRPAKVFIDINDHIGKAIYEMVDSNLSLLPVMMDDKVVGVVRSVDVFNEMAQLVLNPE